MDQQQVLEQIQNVRQNMQKIMVGKETALNLLLIALLSKGHALLDGAGRLPAADSALQLYLGHGRARRAMGDNGDEKGGKRKDGARAHEHSLKRDFSAKNEAPEPAALANARIRKQVLSISPAS